MCSVVLYSQVTLLLLAKYSQQYGRGAPESSCNDMKPNHGSSAQRSASPYAVYISSSQYPQGGDLTVIINGSQQFKGFLLMASTPAFNGPIGTFTTTSYSQLVCSGRALTQRTTALPPVVSATWTAPTTLQGPVQFFVTVVKDMPTFWVMLKSINVTAGRLSAIIAPSGSSPTSRSGSADTSSMFLPSSTILYASATAEMTTANSLSLAAGSCGVTNGCFSSPGGCAGSACSYLLIWELQPSGTNGSRSLIKFLLNAQTTDNPGYVSVGFAKTVSMRDLSVVNCVSTNSGVRVTQTYSSRNSEPSPIPGTSNLLNMSATATGNRMQCSFTWNNDAAARQSIQQFDLGAAYYVILARGRATGNAAGNIMIHVESPVATSSPVVLGSSIYKHYTAGTSLKTWLVKVHGIFMATAWVLCCTTSVLLASYYKKRWIDSKLCGEKIWFAFHRSLAGACTALTAVAIILVFIAIGGWSQARGLPDDAHAYIGVIVTALATANSTMGIFRGNHGTKRRKFFNWAHWAAGNLALVLAGAAVLIGLRIDDTICPKWLTYVAGAYLVWFGIVYFGLMILARRNEQAALQTTAADPALPAGPLDNSFPMKTEEDAKKPPAPPSTTSTLDQDSVKDKVLYANLVITAVVTIILVTTILAN